MNQYNYLKRCIKKRVTSFIRQYHADYNYIFWPDQTRAHYAKSVINHLNKNNVNFVCKNDNPVSIPNCRPIKKLSDFFKIASIQK